MEKYESSDHVINHYESKSGMRTATGVLASLFWMGCPVALTEGLRAGGDMKIALYGVVATVIAIVLSIISIRGTMTE
ncbi:MAG: hypothetical protein JWM57_3398 [Phycisphaerales bacterium]|jgi:hypothetical protein|nr:hypothetical protein [Phycisphaerales bacterium]